MAPAVSKIELPGPQLPSPPPSPICKQATVCGLVYYMSKEGVQKTHGLIRALIDPTADENTCSTVLAEACNNGEAQLRIDLNGHVSKINCVAVADLEYDLILGLPWLRQENVLVNHSGRTLMASGVEFRCKGEDFSTPDSTFELKIASLTASLHQARYHVCAATSGEGRQTRAAKRKADAEADERSTPAKVPKTTRKTKPAKGGSPDDDDGDDSDYDDDGDSGGKKPKGGGPKKSAKKKPQSRSVPVAQSNVAPNAQADKTFSDFVSLVLQRTDASLSITRRIAERLKHVKLRRVVKPFLPKAEEKSTEELLRGPAVPGRDVRPLTIIKEGSRNRWLFKFNEVGSVKVFTSETKTVIVPFALLPPDTPLDSDSTIACQLHKELARCFNTWPWAVAQPQTMMWVSRILTRIASRNPEIFDLGDRGKFYSINFRYINQATGELVVKGIAIHPTNEYLEHVVVPTLPDMILRSESAGTTYSDQTKYYKAPQSLDSKLTSAKSQRIAQDALRWMALQLDGIVTTKDRVEELITLYRGQLGLITSNQTGLYGGESRLYQLRPIRLEGKIRISPSEVIGRDLIGVTIRQLDLAIRSFNASRSTPVLETILQLFCDGDDIRRVWIEAAKTADQVNADISEGIPPSSQCDCDDTQASMEVHPCEGCGLPAICQTRQYDTNGRLVCIKCYTRDRTSVASGRNPGETLVVYLLRNALYRAFRAECKVRNIDPESKVCQDIFKRALANLQQKTSSDSPTTFRDSYTGKTHEARTEGRAIGQNPSRARWHPHQMSVDAVFPIGSPKNQGFKHSEGNLEPTTVTCNYAKFIYLPGTLHVMAEYLKIEQPSTVDREKLLQCIMDMSVAKSKHRFVNAAKVGTAEKRYQKTRAEMIRGKPAVNEPGPWDSWARRITSHPGPKYDGRNDLWGLEAYDRLQKCAETIATFFGVKNEIYTLEDGTAWFGDSLSNPTELDRNGVFAMCHERLNRMRLDCNKKWQTLDNEETLYAEIMFQYCASRTTKPELSMFKKKYGDRLGLPLVLWTNSPLCLSIAHRVHGLVMFTGWPNTSPSDVMERIKNDSENNMLMESWYVNAAKQYMAEDYYSLMDDTLRSVNVDKAYYDPDHALPEGEAETFTGTDNIVLPDEFEGQGFDTEVLEQEAEAEGVETDETGENPELTTFEAPAAEEEIEGVDVGRDMQEALRITRQFILEQDDIRERFVTDTRISTLLGDAQGHADRDDRDAFKISQAALTAVLNEDRE